MIWPHERKRVVLHRRPVTMYEIDLGLHRAVVTTDLPSRGYAASFHASISVQWRVFDPSAIVRHRVLDIEEPLSAALLQRARSIARDYSIDEVTAAEDKINDQLGGVEIDVTAPTGIEQAMREATGLRCLGAEYGLWTRAIAHLTLDKAATEHNTKMMKLKWAIEEEAAEQRLRVIQNRNQQAIIAKRMDFTSELSQRAMSSGLPCDWPAIQTRFPLSQPSSVKTDSRVAGTPLISSRIWWTPVSSSAGRSPTRLGKCSSGSGTRRRA